MSHRDNEYIYIYKQMQNRFEGKNSVQKSLKENLQKIYFSI